MQELASYLAMRISLTGLPSKPGFVGVALFGRIAGGCFSVGSTYLLLFIMNKVGTCFFGFLRSSYQSKISISNKAFFVTSTDSRWVALTLIC